MVIRAPPDFVASARRSWVLQRTNSLCDDPCGEGAYIGHVGVGIGPSCDADLLSGDVDVAAGRSAVADQSRKCLAAGATGTWASLAERFDFVVGVFALMRAAAQQGHSNSGADECCTEWHGYVADSGDKPQQAVDHGLVEIRLGIGPCEGTRCGKDDPLQQDASKHSGDSDEHDVARSHVKSPSSSFDATRLIPSAQLIVIRMRRSETSSYQRPKVCTTPTRGVLSLLQYA